MKGIRLGRIALAAALAVPCGAAVATAAAATPAAGVIGLDGGSTLYYTAKPGQANAVSIWQSGAWLVIDESYAVTAGTGCEQVDPTRVQCVASVITFMKVFLGDGNDALIKTATISGWFEGGDGDDLISAGGATTSLMTNWLIGGDGADNLIGGANTDALNGGLGRDTFTGGGGTDSVTYSGRSQNIYADLDGVTGDDGAFGEGDTINADVENLAGGDGSDILTGNASANELFGFSGNDVLNGGGGDDYLSGSDGDDKLDGGVGADIMNGGNGIDLVTYALRSAGVNASSDGETGDDGESGEGDTIGADVENLTGGDGPDVLFGNPLDNRLTGGAGNDVLNGSAGNDRLDGGQGEDNLFGGPGSDWADYSSRTAPLVIDLGGLTRSDGEAGEHDTVAGDVENLQGGSGNDILTGSDLDNIIHTGGGNDVVKGLGGNDYLTGPGGTAYGGENYDICTGFVVVVDCEQTVIIN